MTERKKWCDLCKCSISNNPATIKNHDLGPRHKDNVAKMSNMKEEKLAKDKEKKKPARVLTLTQIEEKANHSYQNNLSKLQKTRDSNAQRSNGLGDLSTMFELSGDWERDMSLGYYYNQSNGCYYDPNSGFYYTNDLGKWVTLKEALVAMPKLSSGPIQKKPTSLLTSKSQTESKTIGQHHKDNITNKREEKVGKDKEKKKKKKASVLTQVEEKEITRSYQNDTSAYQDSNATSSSAQTSNDQGIDDGSTMFGDWEHDMSSGYYYNLSNGCFYDPNSGLFYTHDLGKWVTLKEALAATTSKPPSTTPIQKKQNLATSPLTSKSQPSTQSSLHINKRKRPDSNPKVVSEEEKAALKALEVERKRVEEREKSGQLPIRFTYARRRKE